MQSIDAAVKSAVREFWERESCGERHAEGRTLQERLGAQARARYELEPYIPEFARFGEGHGRDVLEIGVGMGADHLEWARSRPSMLCGIDLTARAIEHARARLALHGLSSDLRTADAEDLPFEDNSFDIVYSWGVLHHTPDAWRAVGEILRVLRPGGTARIMLYHKHSMVGYMLYARFGLMRGRPLRSLDQIFASHLESPGTKAYSVAEAHSLFSEYHAVSVTTRLQFGDLLDGISGQRHRGPILSAARRLWPRWFVRTFCRRLGLVLLVEGGKRAQI